MSNNKAKNKDKTKNVSDIDKEIGNKIITLRLSKGLTRNELADSIGVTHQQLQKYEKGINRITAGRLMEIANFMSVPISDFFEDLIVKIEPDELKRQRLYLEMMRDFINIKDYNIQESVRKLITAISH